MHSSGEKDWYAATMPVRAAVADAAFGERMARLAEIAAQKGTTARYLGKALAAAAALDQIAGVDQALRTALRRRPLQSLLAIERLLKHDATAARGLAERLALDGLTVQAVEEEERRLRGALRPSTVKSRSNEAAAFEERAVEVLSKEYPSFSLASVVGRIGRRANAKAKLVRGLGDLASLYSVPFDQVWRNSAGELLLVELFFVPGGRPAPQVEAQRRCFSLALCRAAALGADASSPIPLLPPTQPRTRRRYLGRGVA